MWDSNSDSNNSCPRLMLFQLEKKSDSFSGFSGITNINVKRSPSTWVLYPALYIIWIPNVGKPFEMRVTKEWGKKKSTKPNKTRQFVPAPRVIARRRWYKAPQKIPVSALAVASLPDIVHHSVAVFESRSPQPFNLYLWMEQVRLTLVKPEWENPLMIPP